MAYFVREVQTCQDRHLGPCPCCGIRLRFHNAIVCYPVGKYLPRFPGPLDCSGADIRCPECESLTACRVPEKAPVAPSGWRQRFTTWLQSRLPVGAAKLSAPHRSVTLGNRSQAPP
ncbi:hypothetical protein [Gloeobacter kilaueensis]|uniref:Uncharacterized protein n=1 Tax=Gloeobacter kilaueensis (strain ATCC BAA-2537 / CCAP 1431/1 / ULC 316 / JS1) TaxID=1183438 RepID=U5QD88_GLOK1|nr:hypothetical protein [Gloeobacter kilaueensis]AGY56831.1 hypothetical protein GKIL_0585 [Gloeobacter kilaueensis JS1]